MTTRIARAANPGAAPPALEQRQRRGKALRGVVPRRAHGTWEAPRHRRDPIDMLVESSKGRIPELVPLRYGRMLKSPFAFYRGAAAIMAEDVSSTLATGIRVQACGDCHLLNFGAFATPERRIIFDINDFDETLVAPWEWDVKRLAASIVVAGRANRFAAADCRKATVATVRSYRREMARCAETPALKAWYSSQEVRARDLVDPEMRRFYAERGRKERRRDAGCEFARLAHTVKGRARIKDDPPLIYHSDTQRARGFSGHVCRVIERYRESLAVDRRALLDRYHLQDVAMKVVGVGSVGTMCGVALFLAGKDDPLFLQIKEARPSILEPVAGESPRENHGERVVAGQRLMQAASDIFLGWTHGDRGRQFYVRQLRDVKIKPVVEIMKPENLSRYATLCGSALARAPRALRRCCSAVWLPGRQQHLRRGGRRLRHRLCRSERARLCVARSGPKIGVALRCS